MPRGMSCNLKANAFYMEQVEIIVPFYGEQSHVSNLLESIFNTVLTNRYLVTLVDDGSINSSFVEQIKTARIPGVRCLRLPEQKGFGAAVNHALNNPFVFQNAKKKIPYVCIMQSDVSLHNNTWLSELGNSLERLRKDGIKMISPLTNNSMTNMEFLSGNKGDKKQDYILKKGEYLPFYCVLCNRELFSKIGKLEEYPYAGFEVQEFANRMLKNGFKQAVCGTSWVNHIGGVTLDKIKKNKKSQIILRKTEEDYLEKLKEQDAVINNVEVQQHEK